MNFSNATKPVGRELVNSQCIKIEQDTFNQQIKNKSHRTLGNVLWEAKKKSRLNAMLNLFFEKTVKIDNLYTN